MFNGSQVFEEHYRGYCVQLAGVDWALTADILGGTPNGDRIHIPFMDRVYEISKEGIRDDEGNRPDYVICVILAKYILLCPDRVYRDPAWASFKDFKRESHFTNVNFFASGTQQAILKPFAGRITSLIHAGKRLGGREQKGEMPYDLVMAFDMLPRLSLLLLFNDADPEFPARCDVLFQRHAEYYLDPESLAMTSAVLAGRLAKAGQAG